MGQQVAVNGSNDIDWYGAIQLGSQRKKLEVFSTEHGLDIDILASALDYTTRTIPRRRPECAVLAPRNYGLLEATYGSVDMGALHEILKQYIRPEVKKREEAVQRLGARWVRVSGSGFEGYRVGWGFDHPDRSLPEEVRFQHYMDSPIALILTYDGQDCAHIDFWSESDETVLVKAMQGIKEKEYRDGTIKTRPTRGLGAILWKEALLAYTMVIAKAQGFSRFGIQSGKNSTWSRPDHNGVIHMPLDRALRLYDGTAQKLDFTQEANGNWYKQL